MSKHSQMKWVEVLVDCPNLIGLYTYSISEDVFLKKGDIVTVPFGRQTLKAIVIKFEHNPPVNFPIEKKIKSIIDVTAQNLFPENYWEFLELVAKYYCAEMFSVIRTALPSGLLRRAQRRFRLKKESLNNENENSTGKKILDLLKDKKNGYTLQYLKRQIVDVDQALKKLLENEQIESFLEIPKAVTTKQQKAVIIINQPYFEALLPEHQSLILLLENNAGQMWLSELSGYHKEIKQLVQSGHLIIENREKLRLQSGPICPQDTPKILNKQQLKAVEHFDNLFGYQQVLLHGVTGSGKTEVYLQLISQRLKKGFSCLVLVPEIGLTPQITDRFLARFPNSVWVYHSGLSEGERYDTWRQILHGVPKIIIGTRSAVFLPLSNLGLVILDEEHDTSFKQTELTPTYHARKVAQFRAQIANCPLILGSATPSIETWQSAKTSSTDYLYLQERVASRPMPAVEIVDLRLELSVGNYSIFSRSLTNALRNLNGKKAILFINRRGHSTFVGCRSCGATMDCPNCDVSLAYHYNDESKLLRCHYCNYTKQQPSFCPQCSSPYLKYFGIGTQKVVKELSKKFPYLKTIRFDSDTTSNKDSHRQLLDSFAKGDADILIGTQMLSKGLDLEDVTLVGILAADSLLYHSDFRASERAFQTLVQVAGRAGRGDKLGKVILQTYSPEHPVIKAVSNHDYLGFIESELIERLSLGFPPYGTLVLLRFSCENEQKVIEISQQVADLIALMSDCEILGPAPANILRIFHRYRWQILLKFRLGQSKEEIDWFKIKEFVSSSPVSLILDIDPIVLA